jgi:hypothetical protein
MRGIAWAHFNTPQEAAKALEACQGQQVKLGNRFPSFDISNTPEKKIRGKSKRILISNLHPGTKALEIASILQPLRIKYKQILQPMTPHRQIGEPSAWTFVEFSRGDDAEAAMSAYQSKPWTLQGRNLYVELGSSQASVSAAKSRGPAVISRPSDASSMLLLTGLPADATEDVIRKEMDEYGRHTLQRIDYPRGARGGYAWVKFTTIFAVKKAMQKMGEYMDKNKLHKKIRIMDVDVRVIAGKKVPKDGYLPDKPSESVLLEWKGAVSEEDLRAVVNRFAGSETVEEVTKCEFTCSFHSVFFWRD